MPFMNTHTHYIYLQVLVAKTRLSATQTRDRHTETLHPLRSKDTNIGSALATNLLLHHA
jgi:hypothetical protein